MPRYRFSWDAFADEVVEAFAESLGYHPNEFEGSPRAFLEEVVKRPMKRTLADADAPPWVGQSGTRELRLLRRSYEGLVEEGVAPIEVASGSHQWHTFAGGSINRLLASAMEDLGAGKWTAGNLTLKTTKPVATAVVSDALHRLGDHDWDEQARRLVARSSHIQVSKFQPCLLRVGRAGEKACHLLVSCSGEYDSGLSSRRAGGEARRGGGARGSSRVNKRLWSTDRHGHTKDARGQTNCRWGVLTMRGNA